MTTRRPTVEQRGECPYCAYPWSIDVRSVDGELFALRCLDCKQPFVVDVRVSVSHSVHAVDDISPDEVLDALVAGDEPSRDAPPPPPPRDPMASTETALQKLARLRRKADGAAEAVRGGSS